jgi:glutaredoxin
MANMLEVKVYSRPSCHLCDEAKAVIEGVRRRFDFILNVINVESDPELEKRYGEQIPVVFINGDEAFRYHVDAVEFEKKVKRLWRT